jgi:hypothetical protein
MVVIEPLFHQLLLFRAETDMADLAAGVSYRQDQNGMALATLTLRTTSLVANHAMQQRPVQKFGGRKVSG